jgi:hypothetical protein
MVLEETQAELTLQLTDMQAQLKRGKEDTEYQVTPFYPSPSIY